MDPLRRAREHEAKGEIDPALAAYQQVPPGAPEYAHARIRIVGLHLLRGRPDLAEKAARDFASAAPSDPEAAATLGQAVRLAGRPREALEHFERAVSLAPRDPGIAALRDDALRSAYWTPDADLYEALREHAAGPGASPASRCRWAHCLLAGVLNPDVLRWIPAADLKVAEEPLPVTLKASLDARFGGRYSAALQELSEAVVAARAYGSPCAPRRARLHLADGKTAEGAVEDHDATIAGALEAVSAGAYEPLPFESLTSVEFGTSGAWIEANVERNGGRPLAIRVPALYLFTEGCRRPELRDGRASAWRVLAPGVRLGVGGRCFSLDGRPVPQARVRRMEFL